jgi:DNA-binding SARP family transcriptional activator
MVRETWRIEMFGGLAARQGDRVLTHFQTRKVGALLACLSLHLQRNHPREVLAEQLWPGEDWEAIRNRLRHALSCLRHDLEPDPTQIGAVILADRSNVCLNPSAVATDVAEFDAALKSASNTTDPILQAASLKAAIDLYRGDLLPGYYEEWVLAERLRLEEAFGDALIRYSSALAENGDLDGAIDALRRALARDPLREDVHCDLMGLFASTGRTSDAIRQYRDLERLLRQELGASPSAPSREAYERLQMHAPGADLEVNEDSNGNPPTTRSRIEPDGGAVPLHSQFYIVRPTDGEFQAAVEQNDSIVLVKGPRQVGKTSLLARSLHRARETGARVVLTDLQKAATEQLESPATLFRAFADMIADQLDLDTSYDEVSDIRRGWNVNFERFMRREVLLPDKPLVVWALDEVDRLFGCPFSGVVFGLFRAWHNERSLDPGGPWSRLTLAIAYATEATLFISDLNQSPFNVGTRLTLEDFTRGEVIELNRRYGSPIADEAGIGRLFALVGGCPYLVRRSLHVIAEQGSDVVSLECEAARDDGPFGDHLRRLWAALERDSDLCEEVRAVLTGSGCSREGSFYRLRSAGVVVGRTPREATLRCGLYHQYLERKLGVLESVR